MSLAPIDLIEAHPWQRVAFTTYALSLSFFEAVILDALVRGGGGSQALILADVEGVRASISEQGAHSRRQGLRGRTCRCHQRRIPPEGISPQRRLR